MVRPPVKGCSKHPISILEHILGPFLDHFTLATASSTPASVSIASHRGLAVFVAVAVAVAEEVGDAILNAVVNVLRSMHFLLARF